MSAPGPRPDPAAWLLPARSPQVRSALFGAGMLVHDEPRNQVSVLSLAGALVWDGCDGRTTVGELAVSLGADTGEAPDLLIPEIATQLDQLVAAGLVGRPPLDLPAPPPFKAVLGRWATPPLRVVDAQVVVRCHDRAVRDHVAVAFADLHEGLAAEGAGHPAPGGESELGVEAAPDGAGLCLYGRGFRQSFPDLEQLCDALASQLNRVATTSTGVLAMHAGAVRSPQGRVVALTGASGAGKSTLVAALVRAGWDYLTDEAVGVGGPGLVAVGYPKPLALDATSQQLVGLGASGSPLVAPHALRPDVRALRGEVGPLAGVILVDRPAAPVDPARRVLGPLAPDEALAAVAPQLLNLTGSGQDGLDALAALAQQVPMWVLQEPDLGAAVVTVASLLS